MKLKIEITLIFSVPKVTINHSEHDLTTYSSMLTENMILL